MAVRVEFDLAENSTLDLGVGSLTVTRMAKVFGLPGAPEDKVRQAILAPGLPQFLDPHPTINGITLQGIKVKMTGAAQADVEYEYKNLPPNETKPDEEQKPQISVTTSTIEEQTEKDINGAQLLVEHTFKRTDPNGAQVEQRIEQPGTVSVLVPQTVLTFSRKEEADPSDKAIEFVGKVNKGVFFNQGPRIWLCTAIDGQSDDGGVTYNVRYTFQKNESTWDATVIFIDPETNRPPKGLVQQKGIKVFQVYQDVDFSPLNLEQ